jgi:VWFA-related protein
VIEMTAAPRIRVALAVVLLAVALFAAGPRSALAQAPGQPAATDRPAAPGEAAQPESVFVETIDVRVVNVEVVVTDQDGIRVTGLEPADFKLTVDGAETPIGYFTEVRGGDAVEVAAGEPAAVPGLPALAPGERVGTSFLVFIDDYFSLARDRDQVIEALTDNLSMLGPDDRMAVVAFDGKRLTMLSSWSGSQRALERAFKEALRRPAFGLQRVAERRNHDRTANDVRRTASAVSFSDQFRLNVEERLFAEEIEDQVERMVGATAATLRSFAAPPGRKVLLLLSGGWPYSPAAFAVNDASRPIAGSEVLEGQALYAPLTGTANLLGYTIYPVDIPGLGGDFDADASRGGQLQTGLLVEPEERFVDSSLAGSRERERDVQQAFYRVAGETGGRALLNALRLDALPQAVADTRSYYWIGFTPERNRDDASHDIRVAVVRPGLKVRSRESFRDLSLAAENDMVVESALLFGDAPVGGALSVTLGEPTPLGKRLMEVPIKILIPVDMLAVLPVDGGYAGKVELRLAALDAQDRQSDVPTVPLEYRLKSPPTAGAVIPYETRIKLRRERQTLVVTLHDPLSGHTVAARLEVEP